MMQKKYPKANKTRIYNILASGGKFYHFQNLISIFPYGGSVDLNTPLRLHKTRKDVKKFAGLN
jgi:hypothetical protein